MCTEGKRRKEGHLKAVGIGGAAVRAQTGAGSGVACCQVQGVSGAVVSAGLVRLACWVSSQLADVARGPREPRQAGGATAGNVKANNALIARATRPLGPVWVTKTASIVV